MDEVIKRFCSKTHFCNVCLCSGLSDEHFTVLRKELERIPRNKLKLFLNTKDEHGRAPLFYAVIGKSPQAIKLLIQEGADPNITDKHKFTPIFYAVGEFKDIDTLKCLLENKADPNFANNKNRICPFYEAAKCKDANIMKLLYRYGGDPRIPTTYGKVALNVVDDSKECKQLIFDIIRTLDIRKEKKDARCSMCNLVVQNLKRCGKCYSRFYCSRECQVEDWREQKHKKGCKGSVIAKQLNCGEAGYGSGLSTNHHASGSSFDLNDYGGGKITPEMFKKKVSHHIGKHFVVKVQVPISGNTKDMMVSCEDRCYLFLISPEDNPEAYNYLKEFVRSDGISGMKGYFWAQIHDTKQKALRVYHAKMAPAQAW